jgi:hypothetical protein
MSTLYQIDQETATTVSAADQFPMYKTSTGRTMKASGAAIRTYVLGTVSTETLGFFGATSVAQPTSSNQAAATNSNAVSVSATQWAYATSTQANSIVTLVNQIRSDLVTLGLIKGS